MAERIVIDLDGTIAVTDSSRDYADLDPDPEIVERLRALSDAGYEIVIHTSRNMRTHSNNLGRITATTVPKIIDWLARHKIPFHEIHVGKPWCGYEGFYVDDRAIRPSEFKSLTMDEIRQLLAIRKQP